MRPCLGRDETGARVLGRILPVLLLAAGCGGGAPTPVTPGASPGVEVRAASGKPPVAILVRDGDPFGGVAVALAHDFGATASVWLGTLLAERVRAEVSTLRPPRPNGDGVTLSARVTEPADAARFAHAVDAALARPFTTDDIARLSGARAQAVPVWKTDGEAATARCTGELGEPRAKAPPSVAELERVRAALRGADVVAFATVGSRGVGEATAQAVSETSAWEATGAVTDPWPPADVVTATAARGDLPTLAVALRVPADEQARAAARTLGARDSTFARHLGALDPAWNVERIVAVSRPRGACLRFDVRATSAASLQKTADVAALVVDEASRATESAGRAPPASTPSAVDPRDAAEEAAWHALTGRLPAGAPRIAISATTSDEALAPRFASFFADAQSSRKRPSVEARFAQEAGQPETWALLASPCATASETSEVAGATALAVRAIAREADPGRGVVLEPWVSADGVGLIAHGPGGEGLAVATAVARALAETRLEDPAIVLARSTLSDELRAEAIPLWPAAFEALSPKHPSLLDPRGTFRSVTELGTPVVEAARHTLLRLPLRVAVLSPEDGPERRTKLSEAIERELRPDRGAPGTCPDVSGIVARPGAYDVSFAESAGAGTRALVAVTLPQAGQFRAEAERTAELMNRPGGLLDSALRGTGLAVHAEAAIVGGASGAAFAVELATTGKKLDDAVAQVRALFSRLAEGAASPEDLARAESLAVDAREAAVDPRQRLVALWLGRAPAKPPDLAALRRFHRTAFAADRHVVVIARPRP
ncbi:MAG TPA: hypothetical protein VHE30_09150 [Polyangiaceae bacterium]|nr:hypothetical protein [Polyangiaceae bacterium]